MAATLTADQELLHFSFPIEKQEDTDSINPIDGTPDVLIWGKATDGTVDADRQIVDPEWSAAALKEWVATGGNVRMSHDPKRPVGKGQDVQVTMDGHYVKSLICDPLAKHFIRNGVLNDYSVGISAPHIKYGPDKSLDPRGAATGGIITGRPDGLSKIAELSVVDRGSNFHSSFQIAKAAGDGAEFVGKMIGDEDEIAKAAPASLTKASHDGLTGTQDGGVAEKSVASAAPAAMDTWAAPDDLSITFTPNDLARMVQNKFVEKHYDELARQAGVEKRDFDPNVGGGVDRDKLPESDFAGRNRSFPIKTQGDVSDALQSVGRAGDDNYDAGTLRSNIIRIARRKGFSVPGADDSKSKGTVTDTAEKTDAPEALDTEVPEAVKEAEPEVIKDPEETEDAPAAKKAKKPKNGKKKLPSWLNKPDDGDGDSDDDGMAGKAAYCETDHAHTEKCHTDPAQAAGVTASPMSPAPVGELMETPAPDACKSGPDPASASGAVGESMTPVPAHREPDGSPMEAFEATASMSDGDSEKPTKLEATMKGTSPEVAALLRFQHAGIDPEAGRLHDLTCPAYHPADVAKHHPYTDFASAIDLDSFQRKAMKAAAGGDLSRAKAMQQVLYAASALKTADAGWLNDCRLAAYKAFRDANPGPSTFPTPGNISPQSYNRPLVTDGHEASSPGHDGPNSSPQVATSAPDAHNFDRPPLSSGHQSPSPSFMKASFEYPDGTGRPMQLNYASMEKDRARQALMQVHEHLSRQFPEACPMSLDGPQQPENHPVPPTAGIGKAAAEPNAALTGPDAETERGRSLPERPQDAVVANLKAAPEEDGLFMDADIYKGFKKQRKKLGKKVLAGKMTVDEARAKLGRQFAQKGDAAPAAAVQKAADEIGLPLSPIPPVPAAVPNLFLANPEVRKSFQERGGLVSDEGSVLRWPPAPMDASAIELAVTKALAPIAAELTSAKTLLAEQQETFTTKLAEQQRVIDAIADQPDPSTAAFSGLAFNPVQKSAARPAAVPDIAESAARAQDMIRRNLQSTYYTHSSPAVREAAGQELAKLGWEPSMT